MKPIAELKQEFFDAIPLGIDLVIELLKQNLPVGSEKYRDVIQLEGRYKDNKQNLLRGTVSDRDTEIIFNQIREALINLVGDLSEADFQEAAVTSKPAGNSKIRKGNVFYRIPEKMQVEKEVKCIIRLAFDKESLLENLERAREDKIADVRISEVMGAELIDPSENKAFSIRSFSETVQFVDEGDYTEWLFYVKPLFQGTHPLLLKISIIEMVRGRERKKEVVLEETIQIISAPVPEEEGEEKMVAAAGMDLNFMSGAALAEKPASELPVPPAPVLDQVSPGTPSAKVSKKASPAAPAPPPPTPAPAPAPTRSRNNGRRMVAFLFILLATSLVFIFSPPRSPEPTDINYSSAEDRSWQEIRESVDTTDFLNFIKQFPQGKYRDSAFQMLETLRIEYLESENSSLFTIDADEYPGASTQAPAEEQTAQADADSEEEESTSLPPDTASTDLAPDQDQPDQQDLPEPEESGNPATEEETEAPTDNAPAAATPSAESEEIKTRTGEAVSYGGRDLSRNPLYRGCKEGSSPEKSEACMEIRLARYIKSNMRCRAQEMINLRLRFIIDKEGRIKDAFAISGNNDECAEMMENLLKKLPTFKPGLNKAGEPVEVSYDLPIRIKPN